MQIKHYSVNRMSLLVFILPTICFSQVKKDNTIIAHGVKFDSAVNRLLDLGYHIEKIDKDFKTAQTNTIKYDVVIFIREKNNDLIINGEIWSMGYKIPIEYGWGSKKRWETLMEFAKVFDSLEYKKVEGKGVDGIR